MILSSDPVGSDRRLVQRSRIIYACGVLVLGLVFGFLGATLLRTVDSMKMSITTMTSPEIRASSHTHQTGSRTLSSAFKIEPQALPVSFVSKIPLSFPGVTPTVASTVLATVFKSAQPLRSEPTASAQTSPQDHRSALTGNDQRTFKEIAQDLHRIAPIRQELRERQALVHREIGYLDQAKNQLDSYGWKYLVYPYWLSAQQQVNDALNDLKQNQLPDIEKDLMKLDSMEKTLKNAQENPSILTDVQQNLLLKFVMNDPLLSLVRWLINSQEAFDSSVNSGISAIRGKNWASDQHVWPIMGYDRDISELQKMQTKLDRVNDLTKAQLIAESEQRNVELKKARSQLAQEQSQRQKLKQAILEQSSMRQELQAQERMLQAAEVKLNRAKQLIDQAAGDRAELTQANKKLNDNLSKTAARLAALAQTDEQLKQQLGNEAKRSDRRAQELKQHDREKEQTHVKALEQQIQDTNKQSDDKLHQLEHKLRQMQEQRDRARSAFIAFVTKRYRHEKHVRAQQKQQQKDREQAVLAIEKEQIAKDTQKNLETSSPQLLVTLPPGVSSIPVQTDGMTRSGTEGKLIWKGGSRDSSDAKLRALFDQRVDD